MYLLKDVLATEETALGVIYYIIAEMSSRVKNSWFISPLVKEGFLDSVEEYYMLGRPYLIVYSSGIPHDLTHSTGRLHELFYELQCRIISIDGMPEALEKDREKIQAFSVMKELTQ